MVLRKKLKYKMFIDRWMLDKLKLRKFILIFRLGELKRLIVKYLFEYESFNFLNRFFKFILL